MAHVSLPRTLEQKARRDRRVRYVQQAVLTTIAVAGVCAWTMVAPNTLQLLGGFNRNRSKFTYQAKTVTGRLAKKGLVRFVEKDKKRFVEITEKGRRAFELERAKIAANPKKKRRWDKRWRLVMFDIPQRRKGDRDRLRQLMREVGFLRLQNSVWISPYDSEELITLIKADMHFGKDVIYAVVEQIENDGWVKKHFSLK